MSLACTSKETIAPGARMALAQSTTGDFIRVPSESGTIEFGPNATLHIGDADVPASDVYLTRWGLIDKEGNPLASWDESRFARVEQVDGAATVAIAACAAIVIVGVAMLLKSGPNLGGSGSKSSGSSRGGGSPKAASTRSAPNPSPIIPEPNPAVTEVAFRTIEVVASGRGPSITVPVTSEEEPDAAIPLFSRGARRRAMIRALARLEGGVCWPSAGGDCFLSGARVGTRLFDMVELSGGVRVESNATRSTPLGVIGAMLHGELPSAHWFALAVGASVAFDDVHAHVIPQLAVRLRPVRGFWLGLMPIVPVYAAEKGGWTVTSSLELTGEL